MQDTLLHKLIKNNVMSTPVAAYLKLLLDTNHSGIIVGPTKSGKTTILDCTIDLIQKPCRIGVIEDVPELRTNKKNRNIILDKKIRDTPFSTTWIPQAMRNRPDMILFGELQLKQDEMNHITSAISADNLIVSTMHAASVKSAVNRLESVDFAKYWKWIIFTKKSNNDLGFEIESISEIISDNDNVRVISTYSSDENQTLQTILKQTYHLIKSPKIANMIQLEEKLNESYRILFT
jgi:type IV secretory pathway ATPase VirB11/archaellum biosynthesis ATPase